MRLSAVRNGIVDLLRCGEAPLTREEILSGLRTKKKIFCGTKTRLALGKIGKLLEGLIEAGVASNGEGKTVVRKNGGCEYDTPCYRLTQPELDLAPAAKTAPLPKKSGWRKNKINSRSVYDAVAELGEATCYDINEFFRRKGLGHLLEYAPTPTTPGRFIVPVVTQNLEKYGLLEKVGLVIDEANGNGHPLKVYRVAKDWPAGVPLADVAKETIFEKAKQQKQPPAPDYPKLSLEDLVAAIEEGARNKKRVVELELDLDRYKVAFESLRIENLELAERFERLGKIVKEVDW